VMQLFLRCLGARPPASLDRKRFINTHHAGLQQGRHVDRARPLPFGWILLLAALVVHVDAPVAPLAVPDLRGRGQRQVGPTRHLPERRLLLSIVLYMHGVRAGRRRAADLSGARPPEPRDASLRT
jgi:hypothetical protein